MDDSAVSPNQDSVQCPGSVAKHTTTVMFGVNSPNIPETEAHGPDFTSIPALCCRRTDDYNLSAASEADVKMIEIGQEDGGKRRTACSAYTQQWTVMCSILLAQYVCTAAIGHQFAYLRNTSTDDSIGRSHFGLLVATPIIVVASLYVLLQLPQLPFICGLSIVTVSQIVLVLVYLIETEWNFYSHLLAFCLLGVGVFFTERYLLALCHLYHRLLIFFLALAIQPAISAYLHQVASYLPALLMSFISLAVTILNFSVRQKLKTNFLPSAAFTYNSVQLNSPLDDNSMSPYQIISVSRQLVLFSTFYLIWGKLATISLFIKSAKLDFDYKPLVFLTFGGTALAVSSAGACANSLVFRPRTPSCRLTLAASAAIATVAIACVVIGLLLDSTLILNSQEIWSQFTAKTLLGAGLAGTAGLFFFVDGNGNVGLDGLTDINVWPLVPLRLASATKDSVSTTVTCAPAHTLAATTDCSAKTVTATTTCQTTTLTTSITGVNTRSDRTSDDSLAQRTTPLTLTLLPRTQPASVAILGTSIWSLISVGGAFGIAVSASLAMHHDHWIVNVVDLVIFLAPIGLLAGECVWLWRQVKQRKVDHENSRNDTFVITSQMETSKL